MNYLLEGAFLRILSSCKKQSVCPLFYQEEQSELKANTCACFHLSYPLTITLTSFTVNRRACVSSYNVNDIFRDRLVCYTKGQITDTTSWVLGSKFYLT